MEWYLYETKEYKLHFPGKPVEETRTINYDFGELKLTAHIFQVGDTSSYDNLLFGILETEYPESVIQFTNKASLDTFFSKSIDGAVAQVHGKLISKKNITKGKFPGREINIDYGEGQLVITMRLYLVNKMMYQLQTISKPSKTPNKLTDKFMDSFTLK